MRIRGLRNGSLVAVVVVAVTGGVTGSASGAPRRPDPAGDDAGAVIVVLADQHDEAPATAAGSGRRRALAQADQQPLVAQARQAGAVGVRQFSVLNGFAATMPAAARQRAGGHPRGPGREGRPGGSGPGTAGARARGGRAPAR